MPHAVRISVKRWRILFEAKHFQAVETYSKMCSIHILFQIDLISFEQKNTIQIELKSHKLLKWHIRINKLIDGETNTTHLKIGRKCLKASSLCVISWTIDSKNTTFEICLSSSYWNFCGNSMMKINLSYSLAFMWFKWWNPIKFYQVHSIRMKDTWNTSSIGRKRQAFFIFGCWIKCFTKFFDLKVKINQKFQQ